MLQPKHKKYFLHKLIVILFLFVGGLSFVLLSMHTVQASIPVGCPGTESLGPPSQGLKCPSKYVYQTNSGKACSGTDRKLDTDKPFKRYTTLNTQTSYFCVHGLQPSNLIIASKDSSGKQFCPSGGGGITGPYGLLCLTNMDGFAYDSKSDSTGTTSTPFQQLKDSCKEAVLTKENCGIIRYTFLFINALSALVGVVIIIMIIVGGIEYSASSNDPQRVAAARSKITNALLALLLFIFMYAFLQWVVPGGVFK